MGEFEDESVASPADTEPVEPTPDPDAGAAEDAIVEEPEATQAPAGDTHDQLQLDAMPGEASDVATVDGSEAETVEPATEVEPTPEADGEVEPEPEIEPIPDTDGEIEPATEPAPEPDAGPAEPVAEEPPSDEDLAAAVEAANEQVAEEPTLDDIAPVTVQVVPDGEIAEATSIRYGAPWWPFLIYLGLWIVFAGVAVWQLEQLPATAVLYEARQYTLFVFGGLVLAAAGVLLIIAAWFGTWVTETRQRAGLFSSAFIKGALVILIGVVVWWVTIMALDYLRLGRFL
jgi:hypothetical protein